MVGNEHQTSQPAAGATRAKGLITAYQTKGSLSIGACYTCPMKRLLYVVGTILVIIFILLFLALIAFLAIQPVPS